MCVEGGGQRELFGVLNVCFKEDGGSGSVFRSLLRMMWGLCMVSKGRRGRCGRFREKGEVGLIM